MKKFSRGIITLLIVFTLTLITIGNVMAQTAAISPTPDFSLIYLINGMNLPKDQFDKTVKLTKEFMSQIRHSDATITKTITTGDNDFRSNPAAFERVTVIQHQFLEHTKQYHIELVNAIGPENAMKIFQKVYTTIPAYLLQTTITENNSAVSPTVINSPNEQSNGNTGLNPEVKVEPGKTQGMDGMMMGRIGLMNPSMNMNSMPMSQNSPMNSDKPDAVKRQLLLQLQTSNAMLIQMLNALSNQPASGTVQIQIQTIKQILNNQSALIQMFTANMGNYPTNMAQNGPNGNADSGNIGKM